MERKTATVSSSLTKQLAFWESIIDIDEGPAKYIPSGEKIMVLDDSVSYGGIHGDREYCKVMHPIHGMGYMLKEGLKFD